MLALGKARRRLGQKAGEWTPENNQNMMRNMGAVGGIVTESQFVTYFNRILSSDPETFAKTCNQFCTCAASLNDKKREDRDTEGESLKRPGTRGSTLSSPYLAGTTSRESTPPASPGLSAQNKAKADIASIRAEGGHRSRDSSPAKAKANSFDQWCARQDKGKGSTPPASPAIAALDGKANPAVDINARMAQRMQSFDSKAVSDERAEKEAEKEAVEFSSMDAKTREREAAMEAKAKRAAEEAARLDSVRGSRSPSSRSPVPLLKLQQVEETGAKEEEYERPRVPSPHTTPPMPEPQDASLQFTPQWSLPSLDEAGGARPDAVGMLRRAQDMWEAGTRKSPNDLHAVATIEDLEKLWHRLAGFVPGALAETTDAVLTAEELCRNSGGSINFPAFLRMVTHLPWHHLLSLELQKEERKRQEDSPKRGYQSLPSKATNMERSPPKRLQAPPVKKRQSSPPPLKPPTRGTSPHRGGGGSDFMSRAQERMTPPKRSPSPAPKRKEMGNDFMSRAQDRLSKQPSAPALNRIEELLRIFSVFDIDGSGFVETGELQVLGEARKDLGHKKRIWTPERNAAMIENMDSRNPDGKIDRDEFLAYFLKVLRSRSDEEFMQTMSEFKASSKACAPTEEEEEEEEEE